MKQTALTSTCTVHASIEVVWTCWTMPRHIVQWNQSSADWHTTHAENDIRTGGKFLFAMKTKDGQTHFDFEGIYDEVIEKEKISYTLSDGRKSVIEFTLAGDDTLISESFEPEPNMPLKDQEQFCAAVLAQFKQYAEKQASGG